MKKKNTSAAWAMVQALNAIGTFPHRQKEPSELKGIDIEKEYQLIQEKKSRLSRRLRDIVVAKYERNLKEKSND